MIRSSHGIDRSSRGGSGYLRQQQQDEGKREEQGGSPEAGHPAGPSAAADLTAAATPEVKETVHRSGVLESRTGLRPFV
jgi:hypothetical protein